jgi:hypothetical protein
VVAEDIQCLVFWKERDVGLSLVGVDVEFSAL